MNLQQVVQPRSTANGFGRRRGERDVGTKLENNSQYGKTNPSKLINAGMMIGGKGRGNDSPSRDRLVYLTTCLIGHHVEVQVKDGSIYSGIFHATNAERDFGIILKMARSTRAGSSRGQKAISDSASKGASKTLIIPAKELVQIIGKGVSVTRDAMTNELQQVKQQEIMLDSSISQSRQVEAGRELERWIPDEDDPQCPELDNIFDGPWNRGWDQFQANEALFGVKSTFDEELYTTKLERGPQMRELEKEASRIAREIEGEETQDLHLAEERGIHLHENFDIDEETRFSSVFRGIDDSGYDEHEDILLDSHNIETFGGELGSTVSKSFTDIASGKSNVGAQVSSFTSSMDEIHSSQAGTGRDLYRSGSSDHARQLSSELLSETFSTFDVESRIQENLSSEHHAGSSYIKDFVGKQTLAEDARTSKAEDSQLSFSAKKDGSDKGVLSPNAVAYAPSLVSSSKCQEKMNSPSEALEDAPSVRGQAATQAAASRGRPSEALEDAPSVRGQGATQAAASRGRPGSSTSSTSDCGVAVSALSAPALSPSSSLGSLSSEKSTLNPHAKEFKLNPNARSFIPTQTPLRPSSPVSDGSFYFPSNVSAVPQMHGVPVGIGIGPSFAGHQPVIFNPQAAQMQSPQAYFHPNGPQYGQQMILSHPRQVLYMPTYPPEMPYKGRDF